MHFVFIAAMLGHVSIFSFCINCDFYFIFVVETQFFNPFINIENYVCLLVLVGPFLASKCNCIFPWRDPRISHRRNVYLSK
jgi:hypothetical protein